MDYLLGISLNELSQVATIIATLIASGAIFRWFLDRHYLKNPFKNIHYELHEYNAGDGSGFLIKVVLFNRYHGEFYIDSASLLSEEYYWVKSISGNLSKGKDYNLLYSFKIKDDMRVSGGAKCEFKLETSNISSSEFIKSVRNINIRTDKGSYLLSLGAPSIYRPVTGYLEFDRKSKSFIGYALYRLEAFFWRRTPLIYHIASGFIKWFK